MGAMTQALTDEIRGFLQAPNHAVISTVRPDGQPVSVATWYLLDGDRILVNMEDSRKRIDYLREDPRISLTVLDANNWYNHVSLQGRVVEWRDDEDLADIDRLSRHYGGDQYRKRDRPRVSAWIEVDRCHTWGKPSRS
jgi:PPOX class probable F420-dependent enzyme